jgi:hypothetical protein
MYGNRQITISISHQIRSSYSNMNTNDRTQRPCLGADDQTPLTSREITLPHRSITILTVALQIRQEWSNLDHSLITRFKWHIRYFLIMDMSSFSLNIILSIQNEWSKFDCLPMTSLKRYNNNYFLLWRTCQKSQYLSVNASHPDPFLLFLIHNIALNRLCRYHYERLFHVTMFKINCRYFHNNIWTMLFSKKSNVPVSSLCGNPSEKVVLHSGLGIRRLHLKSYRT